MWKYGRHPICGNHKRSSITLNKNSTRAFQWAINQDCTPLLLPQNGDKVPKFVVFWTISTIQDEKSAAKFHYIKTFSGKVVTQSIAFWVVSIYWPEVAPFPWYLNAKGPTRIGSTWFHTLGLIAQQPWRHCVTGLRSAHWLASSLKLAACCPVSRCWPSCKISKCSVFCQPAVVTTEYTLYSGTWVGTDKIPMIWLCTAWFVVNACFCWFTHDTQSH